MVGGQLWVTEGEQRGRRLSVEGELLIGRVAPEDDGRLGEDPEISRRHARVSRGGDGRLTIEDLASANGTFVNGERISRVALRDGDKIQIGTATILKFSYQDALDEALQKNLYDSATRDALTSGAVVLAHDGIGPGARREDAAETLRFTELAIDHARRRGIALEAL